MPTVLQITTEPNDGIVTIVTDEGEIKFDLDMTSQCCEDFYILSNEVTTEKEFVAYISGLKRKNITNIETVERAVENNEEMYMKHWCDVTIVCDDGSVFTFYAFTEHNGFYTHSFSISSTFPSGHALKVDGQFFL